MPSPDAADPASPAPTRTTRSERTRAALIDAAEQEFGEVSFAEAKISGIMRRAGMAHGTFYTHFQSKEDIFYEVLLRVHARSFRNPVEPSGPGPMARVDANNRTYLAALRDHTRVLASLEELAAINERFAKLRREQRMEYIERTAKGIRRWQQQGVVDADLDAECVAHCLGGMVERIAYMTYTHGEGFRDEERVLATLHRIWASTLGLRDEAGEAVPPAPVRSGRRRAAL